MKKKKLKAKLAAAEKALLDRRMGSVAHRIAEIIVKSALADGATTATDLGFIRVSKEPEKGEPEIIGALRRAAMEASKTAAK